MNISGIRPKGILCRRGEAGTGEKRNASTESGGYPYGGNAASFQ